MSNNIVLNNEDDDKVAKKTTRELHPCLYCNESYGGLGGLKRHLHYCVKNPAATKKKKPENNILEPNESVPCLFCEQEFISTDILSSHIKECHK